MPARSRLAYSIAVLIIVLLGLASRRYPSVLSEFFGKYPGDALWAMMAFFGWGVICACSSAVTVFSLAFSTCLLIELLKLYQAPWIVEIRNSSLGHLVFGSVFSYENLIAYLIGLLAALGLDVLWRRAIPDPVRRAGH